MCISINVYGWSISGILQKIGSCVLPALRAPRVDNYKVMCVNYYFSLVIVSIHFIFEWMDFDWMCLLWQYLWLFVPWLISMRWVNDCSGKNINPLLASLTHQAANILKFLEHKSRYGICPALSRTWSLYIRSTRAWVTEGYTCTSCTSGSWQR